MITTAILTGRASFKAAEIIALRQAIHDNDEKSHQFTTRENTEFVWRLYISPVAIGLLTATSIVLANRIGARRAAAVAVAYSILDKGFEEYKEKVVEKLGTTKEQKVRDEIAQDRVTRNQQSIGTLFVGTGKVLCYDMYTGRPFESTMETIRKAENDINEILRHDHHASLTDFHYMLGLSPTLVSEEVGWNLDKPLEVDYSTTLLEDGRPALTISYQVSPARNYFRQI